MFETEAALKKERDALRLQLTEAQKESAAKTQELAKANREKKDKVCGEGPCSHSSCL